MKDETSPTSHPNPGAFGKVIREDSAAAGLGGRTAPREAIEICLQHNFHPAAFLAANCENRHDADPGRDDHTGERCDYRIRARTRYVPT